MAGQATGPCDQCCVFSTKPLWIWGLYSIFDYLLDLLIQQYSYSYFNSISVFFLDLGGEARVVCVGLLRTVKGELGELTSQRQLQSGEDVAVFLVPRQAVSDGIPDCLNTARLLPSLPTFCADFFGQGK